MGEIAWHALLNGGCDLLSDNDAQVQRCVRVGRKVVHALHLLLPAEKVCHVDPHVADLKTVAVTLCTFTTRWHPSAEARMDVRGCKELELTGRSVLYFTGFYFGVSRADADLHNRCSACFCAGS